MATTSTHPTIPEPWSQLFAAADNAGEHGHIGRLTSVEYALPAGAQTHPEIELLFFSIQCVCGQPAGLCTASPIRPTDTRPFTPEL